jgi:cytochrome c553
MGSMMRTFAMLGALLALPAAGAFAKDSDAADQIYARQLAIGVCGTCHGPHGNSVMPKFPRLAGQNTDYLAAQLKNFRGQTRGDPDAISYMWGMAGSLTDETIDALAKYYSAQTAVPVRGASAADVARGREIYQGGIPAAGVPACAACHGADGRGTAAFPRLAGQHPEYLMKQLLSFQSSMRDVAVMHGVAQNLQVTQMQAVADYLESLP